MGCEVGFTPQGLEAVGAGDDRFRQRLFVDLLERCVALCSSPLPQQPAGMALNTESAYSNEMSAPILFFTIAESR
jgi:hypothetical protein